MSRSNVPGVSYMTILLHVAYGDLRMRLAIVVRYLCSAKHRRI